MGNILKDLSFSQWFLIIMLGIYLGLFFVAQKELFLSLYKIILSVLPVLIIVYVLTFIFNLFDIKLRNVKHNWFFAIIGGIISTGPIYMWYPLLADLRQRGFTNGHIVAFLYNRSIKLPLLPALVAFFGWGYTLLLYFLTIIFSVINGLVADLFLEK